VLLLLLLLLIMIISMMPTARTYAQSDGHAGCAAKLLIQYPLNVPQQQQDGYAGQVIRNVQLQEHLHQQQQRQQQQKMSAQRCMKQAGEILTRLNKQHIRHGSDVICVVSAALYL
jgi:uncharacterized protein YycO